MWRRLALCGAFFLGSSVVAQTEMPVKGDQAAIVAFAQKAALRAVNFDQGDIASLNHAGTDFTPEAWKDFMKHLEGFLDKEGARCSARASCLPRARPYSAKRTGLST